MAVVDSAAFTNLSDAGEAQRKALQRSTPEMRRDLRRRPASSQPLTGGAAAEEMNFIRCASPPRQRAATGSRDSSAPPTPSPNSSQRTTMAADSCRTCCVEDGQCVVSMRVALMLVAGLLVLISGVAPLVLTRRMSELLVEQSLSMMLEATATSRDLMISFFNEMNVSAMLAVTGVAAAFPNTTINAQNHAGPTWDLPFQQYFYFLRRIGFPFDYGVVFAADNKASLWILNVRGVADIRSNLTSLYAIEFSPKKYPPKVTFITNYTQPLEGIEKYNTTYGSTAFTFRLATPVGVQYGASNAGVAPWGTRFSIFSMLEFEALGKKIATMRSSIRIAGITFIVIEDDTLSIAATTHHTLSATMYDGAPADIGAPNCLVTYGAFKCRHTVYTYWPVFKQIFFSFEERKHRSEAESAPPHWKHVVAVNETRYLVAHTNFSDFAIPFSVYAITTEDEQLQEFEGRIVVTVVAVIATSLVGSVAVMLVVYVLTRSIRTVIRSMRHIAELGVLSSQRASSDISIAELAELDDAVIELNEELGRLKRFVPVSVRSTLFLPVESSFSNSATDDSRSASTSQSRVSALNPLSRSTGRADLRFAGLSDADDPHESTGESLTKRLRHRGGGTLPAHSAAIAVVAIDFGSCNLYDEQTNQEYAELVSTIVDTLVLCQAEIERHGATLIIASFNELSCASPAEAACQCAIGIMHHVEHKLHDGLIVGSDAVVCIDIGPCVVQSFTGRGLMARILTGRPVDVVQRLVPLARHLGIRVAVTGDVAAACSYAAVIVDSLAIFPDRTDIRVFELLPCKQDRSDSELLLESQRTRLCFSAMLLGNYEEVLSSVTDKDSPRLQRLRRIARAFHTPSASDGPTGKGYVRGAYKYHGWANWNNGGSSVAGHECPTD